MNKDKDSECIVSHVESNGKSKKTCIIMIKLPLDTKQSPGACLRFSRSIKQLEIDSLGCLFPEIA